MRNFSATLDTIFKYWTEGEATNAVLTLRSNQALDISAGDVTADEVVVAVRVIPLDLTEEEIALVKGQTTEERIGYIMEMKAAVTEDNLPHSKLVVAKTNDMDAGNYEVLDAWVDAPGNVARVWCRKLLDG